MAASLLWLTVAGMNTCHGGLIVNPTFTNSAGQSWDSVRRGVVNQAISNWTSTLAGIDDGAGGTQSVTIDLTFAFDSVPYLSYGDYDFSAAPAGSSLRPWDATTDITIYFTVDSFLGSTLWWDPTPGDGGADVPGGRWDALSVAHHEIGHALGFVQLFVDDYQLATESSPWESKIVGNVFEPGGLNVAMRPGDPGHVLDNSLVMGTVLQRGARLGVSYTEIAMLSSAYGYTTVPEPSSLAVFMGIAVCLGGVQRRLSVGKQALRNRCISVGTVVTLLCVICSHAQGGVITAVADTHLSTHPSLGGPGQNHGNDDRMFLIGPVTVYQASPLIRFELSSLAGTTLSSDVSLQLDVVGTHSGLESHSAVHVYEVLVPWDESTVNWNNFGANPGLQLGQDYSSVPLDTLSPLTLNVGDVATFTIPVAKVQSWIDNPSTNFGVILVSSETNFNRDIHFGVREFGQAARLSSPQFVSAASVPEPASLLVFGLGALGMFVVGRKNRRAAVASSVNRGGMRSVSAAAGFDF